MDGGPRVSADVESTADRSSSAIRIVGGLVSRFKRKEFYNVQL